MVKPLAKDGTLRRWSSVILLATMTFVVLPCSRALSAVQAEITTIGDAINLEFSGRTDWPYEVTRSGNKVTVTVPKIDDKSRSQLISWNGPFVSKIEIKDGPDEKDQVIFHLNSKNVQSFDYLTDQPSRLLVDFFIAEEKAPTSSKAEEQKKETANLKPSVAEQKTSQILKVKSARSPASKELLKVEGAELPAMDVTNADTNGVFDGADPDFARFEMKDYDIDPNAILASQENIYLRFPMLQTKDDSLQLLLKNSPEYEIKSEESDENKKARLLLTLFKNKRYAIFLRTIDFFREAYPESKYDEILRYLEADVYNELWLRDKSLSDFQTAMAKYNALLLDYPESPLAERTQLLVAYSFKEREDVLNALAQLERYKRKYPKSSHRFQVNLAIADCFKKLNKADDSERILKEVEAEGTAGEFGVAAAYRRGDIYIEQRDYEKALQTYSEILKKNPDSAKKFASASFNTAEALFWQGQYKKSLEKFKEFLVRFPTSSHGGFAMTRIGELLEILGADTNKVAGAYLESLFRYRGTPGAGIANIRLTKERMKDMKPKEVEASLKEVSKFVAQSDLPRIRDFEVINVADGFFAAKNYDRALDLYQSFYRGNPTSTNLDFFRNRIVKTISQQLRSKVENGEHVEALRYYANNFENWLKSANRLDVDFAVGNSYESMGSPADAIKFYSAALEKRIALTGKPDENKRVYFENIQSVDSLNLRLAAVHSQNQNMVEASEFLRKIRDSKKLSDKEKVEQVQLEAKVARAKGDLKLAERYMYDLIGRWEGQTEKLAPLYFELAIIQGDLKKQNEAVTSIEKVIELQSKDEKVPEDLVARALQAKGDLLYAAGKKEEAVEAYQSLLERYESNKALGSVRYKVGRIQFDEGKISEAEKTWDVLAQKPENKVWAQMAKEQLTHSKWQDDYKKYIERIPAMSGFKESKP